MWENLININQPLINLLECGIDVFDVRLVLDYFVAHHVHDNFCHTTGRSVARSLKDNVLHFATAQVFYTLFTQYPGYGIGHITFTAAIGTYDGGYSVPCEDYFGVVGEGFEAGDFQPLKFEHAR